MGDRERYFYNTSDMSAVVRRSDGTIKGPCLMANVQYEKFFDKVEATFINRFAKQAELSGESAIYKDL